MIWVLWIYLALGLFFMLRYNISDLFQFIGTVIGLVIILISWPAFVVLRQVMKRNRPDNSATTVLQRRAKEYTS